jgi:hypothetical protein
VVSVCVLAIGLAFVWSYVGALHSPKPHHLRLAVVAPPGIASGFGRGGAFAVTKVPSREAAVASIDDRKAYGAVVVEPKRVQVLVASAAGLAVAQGLRTALPSAIRAAAGPRVPVTVTDVKPLPSADASGISSFYLALGLIVANYIGAVFFAFVFGTKPVGRRVWLRLVGGVGLTAVVLGLGEVAIVNAIGPLRGHYVALSLVAILLGTTVGAVTVGLQSAFGVIGTAIAVQIFVVLGNPSSGGPAANPLLPGFWRVIGPYLPAGAGTDLVRNITYFSGNDIGRPLLVLAAWLAIAVAFAAAATAMPAVGLRTKQDRDRAEAERAVLSTSG